MFNNFFRKRLLLLFILGSFVLSFSYTTPVFAWNPFTFLIDTYNSFINPPTIPPATTPVAPTVIKKTAPSPVTVLKSQTANVSDSVILSILERLLNRPDIQNKLRGAQGLPGTSTTYTLPTTDGLPGQVLRTNGAGTLTWGSTGGGGSSAGTASVSTVTTNYVPYTGASSDVNLGIHNLTVDTNSLFVDATNDKVGVGTATPAYKLEVAGDFGVTTTGGGFKVLGDADSPIFLGGYSSNQITGSDTEGSAIFSGGHLPNLYGENIIENNTYSVIVGGEGNSITASGGPYGNGGSNFIGGGAGNIIEKGGAYSAIVSGDRNKLTSSNGQAPYLDFIGGGAGNIIDSGWNSKNVIAGGEGNKIYGHGSSTIAGGQTNTAWHYGFVGGGGGNTAGADGNNYSVSVGGQSNNASGYNATIPGGRGNTASGSYSFAAGRRAKATAQGTFAITDSTDADFTVSTADVFGTRFAGGYWLTGGNVGIGTSAVPTDKLEVNGNIRLTSGSGGQIIFSDGSIMTSAGLGSASTLTNVSDAIIVGDSDVNGTGAIILKTGNTEKMRMLNNGNIGIGTIAPTASIHLAKTNTSGLTDILIDTTTKASGNLIDAKIGGVSKFTVTYNGVLTTSNQVGTGSYGMNTTGFLYSTSTAAQIRAGTITAGNAYPWIISSGDGATKTLGYVAINTDGTEKFRVNSSGNVGIGTTTPAGPLDVNGKLTVLSSGNVGIGTTTPTTKLDVAGTVNATGLTINGVPVATSSDTYWSAITGGISYGSNVNVDGLYLGSSSTSGIKIDASGNVGVGTLTPTTKLDVAGTVNATALTINGVPVSTSSDSYWGTVTGGISYTGGNITVNTNGSGILISTYKGANSIGENIFIGGGGQSSVGDAAATYKGAYNTSVGINSLYSNTTGYENVANGDYALHDNTTGSENTAVGGSALYKNTTGSYNTAIGNHALNLNTTGTVNTATGSLALQYNTTGDTNSAYGGMSMNLNITGSSNAAYGNNSLQYNMTGSYNTANGYDSMLYNISGSYNTAYGNGSLRRYTTGSNNTAIGVYTLGAVASTGSSNVALGYYAGAYETGSNAFYVDNQDRVNTAGDKAGALLYGTFNTTPASQTLKINATTTIAQNLTVSGGQILGSGGTGIKIDVSGNVGIGTTTPTTKLDVVGTVNATALTINGVAVATSTDTYWSPISGGISYGGNVNISSGSAYTYNGANVITAQTALSNYFFGGAGNLTMTGNQNIAVGALPLMSNTTGSYNVVVGQSGYNITTGSGNSLFGYHAGTQNSTQNSIFGYNAAGGEQGGFINIRNNAFGAYALYSLNTGIENTAIGRSSLFNTWSGSYNTAIGNYSLYNNATGSSNVALGYMAGQYETGSNSFYVDNQDRTNTAGDKAKALLYGTFATTAASQTLKINAVTTVDQNLVVSGTGSSNFVGNLGLGTTTPLAKLHVYKGAAGGVITPSTLAGIVIENSDDVSLQLFSPNTKAGMIQFGSSINGAQGRIAYQHSDTATTDYMSFDVLGTERLRIDVNGNLGLGTTAPAQALDLGAVSASLTFSDTTAFHQILTAGTTDLALMPGGNVGIGTTTPTTKLDVAGTVNATGLTVNGTPVATSSDTYWNAVAGGISYSAGNVGIGTVTPAGLLDVNGKLTVLSGGNVGIGMAIPVNILDVNGGVVIGASYAGVNTAPANGMLIQGNVGIGTTAPTSPLDVYGDIRIHAGSGGKIYFADGSSLDSANVGSADALSNAADAVITGDSDASSAGDIIFKIGSAEKMRIANTGVLTFSNLLLGSQITWGTGLGSAVHLLGPTDATYTINSYTSNALAIDSGTTGAINIGTNANAKTITIGNATGATSVVLNSGTGAINIGTNTTAKTITIGNATGATSVVLNSGTGAINIGTSIAKTITIGNTTGATAMVLNTGTGNFALNTSQLFLNQTTGYIGMGTATPGSKLELVDSATLGAELRLREGTDNGTNYIGFKAPNTLASNNTYTWPADYGTNNYVLTTDGTGGLTWTASASTGMSDPMTLAGDMIYRNTANATSKLAVGTAGQILTVANVGGTLVPQWASPAAGLTLGGDAAPDGQIQYRSSGNFTANDYFYLDPTNYELYVIGSKAGAKNLFLQNTSNGTASSSGVNLGNDSAADQLSLRINSSTFTSAGGFTYLWSKANAPMLFGTNNTERMRILAGGNVGIGTATPAGNLSVTQTVTATGALKGIVYTGAVNTNQTLSTEIPAVTITTAGRQWATGVLTTQREVLITAPTYSFVGASTITNAATVAITGAPIRSSNATITNTHGLLIQATAVSTATNSYGLTVNAQTGATNNYAAAFLGGYVGIGTASPTVPLEVKGTGTGANIAKFTDVNTTGCTLATGGTIACSSDVRLKKNIEDINYGLDTVMSLRPVLYNWNYEVDGSTKSLGFIAQEVESIIPKLVSTDEEGMKSLNTTGMVPVLTKAIQEMNLNLEGISGTLSTSSGQAITPATESFVNTFFNNLFAKITVWLADAGNGVGGMFANVFNAKEKICIDGECLTKDDVKALLLLVRPAGTTPTPTPTPAPNPIPVPEPTPEPQPEELPPSAPLPEEIPPVVTEPVPAPEPTLPTPEGVGTPTDVGAETAPEAL